MLKCLMRLTHDLHERLCYHVWMLNNECVNLPESQTHIPRHYKEKLVFKTLNFNTPPPRLNEQPL